MRRATVALLAVAALHDGAALFAQTAARSIDDYVATHQQAIVSELIDLVSIPNARGDAANLRRNADALRGTLERRGFSTELVETPSAPLVIGTRQVPGARRTLLVYAHYDGMPVVPASWQQRTPFEPVLRMGRLEDGAAEVTDVGRLSTFDPEWRLYARSASDDKGPIVALAAALDGLREAGRTPTWNVTVLLDGDEESGSPGLSAVLPQVRERLRADVMVGLDGPSHASGRPTMVFGSRGILDLELTVYGPKSELHSGHYGNWVPNPAMRLVQLLASMKGSDGEVRIDGFYDGLMPLSAEERALLRAVPDDPDGLMKLFGIAGPEPNVESLQDAIQRPSLNIRGLSSAVTGPNASNVIPNRAVASIDIRLVTETPSAQMLEKVRAHIRAQGFHLVDTDPDDATRAQYRDIVKLVNVGATEAYRNSLDGSDARLFIRALTEAFGQPPVTIRTSGGTGPSAELSEALGVSIVGVPTVNFDNNQHSHNENLRLGHLFTAVKTIAAVLTAE